MGVYKILWLFILFVYVETCSKFCDYLVVRQNDEENAIGIPTCPHAGGTDSRVVLFKGEVVKSLERCLSLACEANATVVYYEPHVKCIAFDCESNKKNKDWAYNWARVNHTEKRHNGQTYALPHPYTPRCYNSYFVKRSWNRPKGLKSNCFQITTSTMHVDDLKMCMRKACDDKANVFNFYKLEPHVARCETMHCGWNNRSEDMNLKIGKTSERHANTIVHTYSLAHSTSLSSCKSAFWNDSVQISVRMSQCSKWGMFPSDLGKDDHIPPSLCNSGYNTFQRHSDDSMITASACEINEEGTGWRYYEDQVYDQESCLAEEQPTKWLNVPYPGTPTCNSSNSIFRLRHLRGQCRMSTCDMSEKVYGARDLRQCMIYACEKNYNVINYFSNSTFVFCDLRNCSRLSSGDYDFELVPALKFSKGYDIYGLHESKQHHSKSDMPQSNVIDQMKEAIINIDNKTNGLIMGSEFYDQMKEFKDKIASDNKLTLIIVAVVQILIGFASIITFYIIRLNPTQRKDGYDKANSEFASSEVTMVQDNQS